MSVYGEFFVIRFLWKSICNFFVGFLNFHDTVEELFDQPWQQIKKSTYEWKFIDICLEKGEMKYLETMSEIQSKFAKL